MEVVGSVGELVVEVAVSVGEVVVVPGLIDPKAIRRIIAFSCGNAKVITHEEGKRTVGDCSP